MIPAIDGASLSALLRLAPGLTVSIGPRQTAVFDWTAGAFAFDFVTDSVFGSFGLLSTAPSPDDFHCLLVGAKTMNDGWRSVPSVVIR
jgi:hypothetical protein